MQRPLLHPLAHALALTTLAAPAAAQLPPLPFFSSTSSAGTVGHLGSGLKYRASAVGDLDGNLDPDIVYVIEDDVIVFLNVTVSTASFLLGRSANDVAILERQSGPDELVLAHSGGVSVLTLDIDIDEQTWSYTEESFGELAPGGISALHLGQLDGLYGRDLVGLGGQGTRVVALLDTPQGLLVDGSMSDDPISPAWDLCTARLDGSEARIATVGVAGVQVLDRSGNYLDTIAYSASRGAITALAGNQRDHLAWFRPSGSGDELVVLNEMGYWEPFQVDGPVVAATAADVDNDGDDDLVVSVDDAGELLLLENLAGSFALNFLRLENGQPLSTGNEAEPALGDFDRDGRTDAALADFSSFTLDLFLNNEYPEYDSLVPSVYYLNFEIDDLVKWTFWPEGSHYDYPQAATHLSVRVYNQHPGPTPAWSEPHSDPTPYYSTLVELGGPVRFVAFPYEGPNVQGHDYVTYVEARYVRVHRSGEVIKKFPPYWFAMLDANNAAAIQYMIAHFPNEIFTAEQIGNGEDVGGGAGPPPGMPPGPGGG